jgi:outer membrane protein OmpA-like peptidoglycan-associated protein
MNRKTETTRRALLALLLGLALSAGLTPAQAQSSEEHHEHELGNFISKHAGAKIYSCSSYDTLSGLGPDQVIDESLQLKGVWRTDPKSASPHWIIIELPEPGEITTLMFNTAFLQTQGACPWHVIIEFSTEGPTIGYKRVSREIIREGLEEQIVSIETNVARWVRITVNDTWGKAGVMEMGRVYAYNDVEINMIEMQLMNERRLDLKSLTFESDSEVILPASYPRLEMIAQVLARHPEWKVVVEGHTDSDGSYRYNMVLSQKRADAVRQVLVDSGVQAANVASKGFGFTQRVANEQTEEGKSRNRRVTIVIQD